jgi:hypothetical protein
MTVVATEGPREGWSGGEECLLAMPCGIGFLQVLVGIGKERPVQDVSDLFERRSLA